MKHEAILQMYDYPDGFDMLMHQPKYPLTIDQALILQIPQLQHFNTSTLQPACPANAVEMLKHRWAVGQAPNTSRLHLAPGLHILSFYFTADECL